MKTTYTHPVKCNYCKDHELDNPRICKQCKKARTIYHLELLRMGEDGIATVMFENGFCQTVNADTLQFEGE